MTLNDPYLQNALSADARAEGSSQLLRFQRMPGPKGSSQLL